MQRYGRSDMSLRRWMHKGIFPPPALRVMGHRLWALSDLIAFESRQAADKQPVPMNFKRDDAA
jgi:hypothetical protein